MNVSLTFENVRFNYGKITALRNVTATLQPGITGLLGANGAGKTTLVRLALGLLAPSAGTVSLLGRDPARCPDVRLKVGYLPQHFEAPSYVRVQDYLTSLLLLSGGGGRDVDQAINRVLSLVGMRDHRWSQIKGLSGGMLRRVGLAQALVHRPNLLLLDEPTTGLDPEERVRFYESLQEVSAVSPVLISTHLVDELEKAADNVWILRRGALVWSGSVRDALDSVRDRVREGILPAGSRPLGRVLTSRPVLNGTMWRVLGGAQELPPATPSLLDAYLYYSSESEEPA